MNPEYDKQLESCVQHELQTLGQLEAPPAIARRVMHIIEQRSAAPWYRREWLSWPPVFRNASLAALLTAFGFLCLGSWRLIHFASLTPAAREVSGWFNVLDAAWNAADVLAAALRLAIESLGPAVIVGAAIMLFICYAACVGLGTIYLRLVLPMAFNRRSS